jgi:methyl-accepting chemotaxis protein
MKGNAFFIRPIWKNSILRKLSTQSKDTADRIGKLISQIREQLQEVKNGSERSLRQTEEQAAVTEEITASVSEIAGMIETIKDIAKSL